MSVRRCTEKVGSIDVLHAIGHRVIGIEDAREDRSDHVHAHVGVVARDRHFDLRLLVVRQALAVVRRAIRGRAR